MDAILSVIKFILDLGPTIMMPIIITIMGLAFRQSIPKAIRSGLTVGMGFAGIFLVIGLFSTNLSPAAKAMVDNFGLHLNVLDVGWPVHAAIRFGTPIVPLVFLMGILINAVMLAFNWTKTMDIDLWNYWHFIAAGATGYIVSGGSWSFSILCAVLYEVMVLLMADRTQKMVQDVYGLKGISLPTGSTAAFGFVGIPIGWLIAKIPVIKDIHIDSETIQKRFGIFGEPMVVGTFLGIILQALVNWRDVGLVLKTGIAMGAFMLLMPRMVKLLMEGLIPISESVRDFMKTRYKGRDLYIGLDAAVSIGHPSNISTGLILVPITLLLAIIIPGNKVLPFGDLATIPFYVSFIVASRKGNIFHSVLAGTVVIALSLLMATDFIGVHTQMMQGLEQYSHGHTSLSSLDMGGNFFNWVILKFSQLFY